MIRLARSASLLLTFVTASSAVPRSAEGQTGLLVVAHGATPEWNGRVRETVAAVRWAKGPVAMAFLMGPEAHETSLPAGIERLVEAGVTEIVVVPLMVSSAGGHYHQIRYLVGEIDQLPAELAGHGGGHHGTPLRPQVPIRVTRALDGADELGQALAEIWAALPDADRRRPLAFVAHGPSSPEESAIWLADLDRVTRPIAAQAGVPFTVGLIKDDARPAVRSEAVSALRSDIARLAAGDSVTVLPILVSRGSITTVTIPRDLAGLPIRYHPASLAPSPHLARWIERVALAPDLSSH